jgi:hypothetical protein
MAGVINPCCHGYLVDVLVQDQRCKLAVEFAGTTHELNTDSVAIVPQLSDKDSEKDSFLRDTGAQRLIEIVMQYLLNYWQWSLRGGKGGFIERKNI